MDSNHPDQNGGSLDAVRRLQGGPTLAQQYYNNPLFPGIQQTTNITLTLNEIEQLRDAVSAYPNIAPILRKFIPFIKAQVTF